LGRSIAYLDREQGEIGKMSGKKTETQIKRCSPEEER
jgi:hypothetical protein